MDNAENNKRDLNLATKNPWPWMWVANASSIFVSHDRILFYFWAQKLSHQREGVETNEMDYGNRPNNFQLFVIHVRLITYARQHTRRTIQSHPLWFLIRIFGWFRQVSWLRWFGIKLHTRCAQSKWTEYSAAPFLFQTLSTAALQITRVFLRLRACCAAAPQMCMRGIVAALIKWWQNTAVAETEFVRLSTIVIDESGHACIC